MKKQIGLMCLLLVASTLAFKVSSAPPIEKPQTECFTGHEFNIVAPAPLQITAGVYEFLAPEPLVISVAIAPAPPELAILPIGWPVIDRPLGKLKNKHHSPWLFDPLKIC